MVKSCWYDALYTSQAGKGEGATAGHGIYASKKRNLATMDVYIRTLIQAQMPCTCIYVLTKAYFCLTRSLGGFTVVTESSFPFFLLYDNSRTTWLKGKTACMKTYIYVPGSLGKYIEKIYTIDVKLRSFSLYLCGRLDKMCSALKGLKCPEHVLQNLLTKGRKSH